MTVFRNSYGAAVQVSCIQCVHARLGDPPDGNWREVPCADHLGKRECNWDWQHAKEYVRDVKKQFKIRCTLFPDWKEYWSGHFCGLFEYNGVPRIQSYDEYLGDTSATRYHQRIEAENKKLRDELKIARQRSRARLERLQKITAKPNGHAGEPSPLTPGFQE